LKKTFMAGLTLALVVGLSGCLRFTSDLEVAADNTVSGEYVVAVVTGTGEGFAMTDRELSEELWGDTKLGGALKNATLSDYNQDGYTGVTVSFIDEPLEAFAPTSSHWGITREGDEFVVSGKVSGGAFTQSSSSDDTADVSADPSTEPTVEPSVEPSSEPVVTTDPNQPEPDVRITLSFPGAVTASNGTASGTTVSWVVTEDNTELSARASAIEAPDRARTLAFLITGIVAIAALAYWLAGVIGRAQRGEGRSGGSKP